MITVFERIFTLSFGLVNDNPADGEGAARDGNVAGTPGKVSISVLVSKYTAAEPERLVRRVSVNREQELELTKNSPREGGPGKKRRIAQTYQYAS